MTTSKHLRMGCEALQVQHELEGEGGWVVVAEVVLSWATPTEEGLDPQPEPKLLRGYLFPYIAKKGGGAAPAPLPPERFNATRFEGPLPEDSGKIAEALVQQYCRINAAAILTRLR